MSPNDHGPKFAVAGKVRKIRFLNFPLCDINDRGQYIRCHEQGKKTGYIQDSLPAPGFDQIIRKDHRPSKKDKSRELVWTVKVLPSHVVFDPPRN